jgi:bifunctional DNase/RNase
MKPTRAWLLAAVLCVACGSRQPSSAASAPKPVEVPKADSDDEGEPDEGAAALVSAKPPTGYLEMTVAGVVGTEGGSAVVLVDPARSIGIPVFIGGTEALSIQLRLEGKKYERPLTHDLLDQMIKKLGGRVVAVRVDRIENEIFIGAVLVQRGTRVEEFDSRVSDALALAIGNKVPIYVAKQVIEKSGVDVRKLGIEPGQTAGRPRASWNREG